MKERFNIQTWIKLPKHCWPKDGSWNKFDRPCVLLRINLYGHPLAGLLWELFSTEVLLSLGFEKVKGWECLFVNRKWQVFISVYVDDYKIAGKAEIFLK